MNRTIAPAPIRKTVTVRATPEKAFRVFTDGIDRWWPRSHHIGQGELKKAVLEPRQGGRWYGFDETGAEEEWGEVLAWDPPSSFAYSWRIGTDWAVPAKDAPYSVVTVTFTATETGTHVELTHSNLDAHGEGWQQMRDSVGSDGGWPGLLELYATALRS